MLSNELLLLSWARPTLVNRKYTTLDIVVEIPDGFCLRHECQTGILGTQVTYGEGHGFRSLLVVCLLDQEDRPRSIDPAQRVRAAVRARRVICFVPEWKVNDMLCAYPNFEPTLCVTWRHRFGGTIPARLDGLVGRNQVLESR